MIFSQTPRDNARMHMCPATTNFHPKKREFCQTLMPFSAVFSNDDRQWVLNFKTTQVQFFKNFILGLSLIRS